MANKTKIFSKDDLLRAMRHTKSILAASRYLGCDYNHIKKYLKMYIDDETGKTLFDLHKNASGKGISKFSIYKNRQPELEAILTGALDPAGKFSINEIKEQLLYEGYFLEECNNCGFNEHRVKDYKVPLLLSFKNGNKRHYIYDNLELLCYNCYFLRVGNISSYQTDIISVENNYTTPIIEKNIEMTDDLNENMKSLGINL